MILDKINKTNDIKKLSLEEKKELADEIRSYLLDVVSQNGGHLASNLGIVELTIALESIFDVSKDKIVWDVGHQCYVHKILNGRKNDFRSLRKFGGISGFPNVLESKTDAFNTGHSSTSISAAMGYASARDIYHKDYADIECIKKRIAEYKEVGKSVEEFIIDEPRMYITLCLKNMRNELLSELHHSSNTIKGYGTNVQHKESDRCIYAYEFNIDNEKYVYVGLTNDHLKRDANHRSSNKSSVYLFSLEYNISIPR